VMEDYRRTGLSLRGHPVGFLRANLAREGIVPCAALDRARDGARTAVAGLVLVRQRPGSARGVLFITIEDETGFANLVVWPDLFERQRRLILSAGMLAARGLVQREGAVVHVIVRDLVDLSPRLAALDGPLKVPTRDFR
ncbi:MAG: OB-fold nucleic acid binding domain-containing protein, partial [Acetobacteraceae bacterium]